MDHLIFHDNQDVHANQQQYMVCSCRDFSEVTVSEVTVSEVTVSEVTVSELSKFTNWQKLIYDNWEDTLQYRPTLYLHYLTEYSIELSYISLNIGPLNIVQGKHVHRALPEAQIH